MPGILLQRWSFDFPWTLDRLGLLGGCFWIESVRLPLPSWGRCLDEARIVGLPSAQVRTCFVTCISHTEAAVLLPEMQNIKGTAYLGVAPVRERVTVMAVTPDRVF